MPKQWLCWNCLPLTLLRGRPCQGSPAYPLHCFSGGLEFLLSFSWQNVKCLGSQVFKKKIKLSAFKNKLTNSRCQSQKKLFVLTSLESTRQDLELWLSTTKQGSAIELPMIFVTIWWKELLFHRLWYHGQWYQPSTRQLMIFCPFAKGFFQHCRSHFLADCEPFAISVITALPQGQPQGSCSQRRSKSGCRCGDALGHKKQEEVKKSRLGEMWGVYQDIYLGYNFVSSSLLIFSPSCDSMNSYEPWF